METFKSVVDTLCQPKVAGIIGVLTLVVAGSLHSEDLMGTGILILMVAFVWGFAKTIGERERGE